MPGGTLAAVPTGPDVPAALLESPALLGALAALLALVALRVRRRPSRRRPKRRRSHRPQVGDVWFAEVPFEDGTGSKDRPVLVLQVRGRTCEVARFTSQDRSARRDHVRIPPGFGGLARASWIDLRPRTLPLSALRRPTGHAGDALVAWYRDASDGRGTV